MPAASRIAGRSRLTLSKENGKPTRHVYIEDTSSNGTFVNKVRLGKGKRQELRDQDLVALASTGEKPRSNDSA